jgi:hypothetical protein
MKILLVNPPRFNDIPVIREERCEITERYSVVPPYSLLQVASLLRDRGHEISIIDANVLDLDYEELKRKMSGQDYDTVIFRFTPTTFDTDMILTKVSKEQCPDAKTIGICWTMRTLPEELDKARLMAYRSLYLNPRWVLQNIRWVIRYPENLSIAVKYYIKALDNLLIKKMRHAHEMPANDFSK